METNKSPVVSAVKFPMLDRGGKTGQDCPALRTCRLLLAEVPRRSHSWHYTSTDTACGPRAQSTTTLRSDNRAGLGDCQPARTDKFF